MQAQAIDPKAIAAATRAPMYGQIGSTVGGTALQMAAPTVKQQVQAKSLEKQMDLLKGVDFTAADFNPGDLTGAQTAAYIQYQQAVRPSFNPYGPTR